MSWADNAVDQLVVGDPQGQHVYIGPGDANGNEGVFLYGPDGVTVLAAFNVANSQSYFTAQSLALPAAGDAGGPALIKTIAGALVLQGPQSSPAAPAVPLIQIDDEVGAAVLITADQINAGPLTPGHGVQLLLQGSGSQITANAFTAGAFRAAHAGRSGTSDNFASGSMVGLASVSLPSGAPAGTYAVKVSIPLSCTAVCTAYRRVLVPGGGNLTADDQQTLDTAGRRYPYTFAGDFQHSGGAGTVQVFAEVSTGTGTIYNAPFRLDVAYLGS